MGYLRRNKMQLKTKVTTEANRVTLVKLINEINYKKNNNITQSVITMLTFKNLITMMLKYDFDYMLENYPELLVKYIRPKKIRYV